MAISSHLGWTTYKENDAESVIMFLKSDAAEDEDEKMYQCIKRFWSMEEMGISENEAYSQTTKGLEVMEDFEKTVTQLEDKHY